MYTHVPCISLQRLSCSISMYQSCVHLHTDIPNSGLMELILRILLMFLLCYSGIIDS